MLSMERVLGEIEGAWCYTKICLESCLSTVCTANVRSVESSGLANSSSAICMESARARGIFSVGLGTHRQGSNPNASVLKERLRFANKPIPSIRDNIWNPNVTVLNGVYLVEEGSSAGSTALTIAANQDAKYASFKYVQRGKIVAVNRVQRDDILDFGVCVQSQVFDLEDLCFLILLQLMSLKVFSVWVDMSSNFSTSEPLEVRKSVQPLDIYRSRENDLQTYEKLDPYSKILLETAIELEDLGKNMFSGSPYDTIYPADDELLPSPTEVSNFYNSEYSKNPVELNFPVSENEWVEAKSSASLSKPSIQHYSGLTDLVSNENSDANNFPQESPDQSDKIMHSEENENTPLDSISLLRASPETNTTALGENHSEGKHGVAVDDYPAVSPKFSEEEKVSITSNGKEDKYPKTHPRNKARDGFLISSLLRGNSPKREHKKKKAQSVNQQLHASQVRSKARDIRMHTSKTHTREKNSLSKNRKRKRKRRVHHNSNAKTWHRSNTGCQNSGTSNTPKAQCTESEDEKILVVNYRKNGSRLVTFSDKNGFQRHLSLFIDSGVENHKYDFDRQINQVLTDSSSQSLPCNEASVKEEIKEIDSREVISVSDLQNKRIVSNASSNSSSSQETKITGNKNQEPELELAEPEKENTSRESDSVGQVTESSFVERLEQSHSKESIPHVPLLENNDNFAPRESPEQLDFKNQFNNFSEPKESEQRLPSDDSKYDVDFAPKTMRAHTLRPETPTTISPLKSILTDPAKRSPESKLLRQRVSFDFSQPDPWGAEANSYPVLPLYSPGEGSTSDAESRLRHLFQAEENYEVNNVTSVTGEYIRLEADTSVGDLIGDSRRVFEYPGSTYLSSYW